MKKIYIEPLSAKPVKKQKIEPLAPKPTLRKRLFGDKKIVIKVV